MKIKKNIILAPHTSFGIGGPAEYFIEVKGGKEIKQAISWAKKQKIQYHILGGGTNVLVSDKGVKGLVIKIVNNQLSIVNCQLTCSAGLPANKAAIKTAAAGLSGLHYFAGLPGTVGGALYKNSHWYDHHFSDCLTSVEVLDEKFQAKKIKKEKLVFTYDWSSFQQTNLIILKAAFNLKKENPEVLKKEVEKILKQRSIKQPKGGSLGCIFKNPSAKSAGRLIENAGLKGKQIGGIIISPKHANFFINKGVAKASDVNKLIKLVQNKVHQKFKINLEPEIFFWGEFERKVK